MLTMELKYSNIRFNDTCSVASLGRLRQRCKWYSIIHKPPTLSMWLFNFKIKYDKDGKFSMKKV